MKNKNNFVVYSLIGTLCLAVAVSVIFSSNNGTLFKGSLPNPFPQNQSVYVINNANQLLPAASLSGVWALVKNFRVEIPSGLVVTTPWTESGNSDYYHFDFPTLAEFNVNPASPANNPEPQLHFRPALTFDINEITHKPSVPRTDPLAYAKNNLANVPAKPQTINIAGVPGIKYGDTKNGITGVYVVNLSSNAASPYAADEMLTVIGTTELTAAQLDAVVKSITMIPD